MYQTKLEKILNDIQTKKTFRNKEEKIKIIQKIMTKENKKSMTRKDCELINECINTLSEYEKIDIQKSNEGVEARTNERLAKLHIRIQEIESSKKNNIIGRKRWTIKYFVHVGFILVLLLVITQFVAMAFDYNPIIEIYKMITSNKSEQNSITENNITENNITYTYLDNTKSYNSIDELISNENIDIIYPLNLPDDIRIIDIHKNEIDGYDQINIVFNTDQLLFMINGKHLMNIEDFTNYNKYDIEDIEMYIFTRNNEHEAIFYHNNYEYNITSTDYEILIEIINNLSIPS